MILISTLIYLFQSRPDKYIEKGMLKKLEAPLYKV